MEPSSLVDYINVDPITQHLIDQANAVRLKAHVPYSNFAVGAALLTENDKIITGCNVENASLGLSICAERTALTKAISEGLHTFKTVVVVASASPDSFTTPCGACRQFIKEFDTENNIVVYCARPNDNSKVFRATADQLLPYSFKTYKHDV